MWPEYSKKENQTAKASSHEQTLGQQTMIATADPKQRLERLSLLGCSCLDVRDVPSLSAYILQLLCTGRGGYSVAINAEKIMMYRRDPEMRRVIDGSILPTPDGVGAVMAARWLHGRRIIKLDLPKTVLELADDNRLRLFVLGAPETSNARAVEVIGQRYPNIEIVGRRDGYFDNEDVLALEMEAAKPQIVLVALGSPKQEMFSPRIHPRMPRTLFISCGGAVDILSGRVRRAPQFFVDHHIEWLYRLIKQPRRWRRQTVLPLFLFRLLSEAAQSKP